MQQSSDKVGNRALTSYSVAAVVTHEVDGRVNHVERDVKSRLVFVLETLPRSFEKVLNARLGPFHWLPATEIWLSEAHPL